MKLSLSWIFDHIEANWKEQDANEIYAKFNSVTAEIEHFYPIKTDLSDFCLGKVLTQSPKGSLIRIPEKKTELLIPTRTANNGDCLLIRVTENKATWATYADFGIDKEGLMPALNASEEDLNGGWKNKFETEDIILEVDNKSITHRPDMWGHRGFAREIAAFMNLPLKNKNLFLAKQNVMQFDVASQPTRTSLFTIENKAPQVCNLFAGLYFPEIENRPSDIFMASRLIKVGSRPISMLVDLTNYLMLDWSQPVHAYDADKIPSKKVIIRMAHEGEVITLLDESKLQLTNQDLVIADEAGPMGLAGVRGGNAKSLFDKTKSIFFEAANFDAGYIRRTAQRHKQRTDASARFEKTLDPNQTIDSALRFLQLLTDYKVKFTAADEIIAVGKKAQEYSIQISHDFLEKRSGIKLTETDVIKPLEALGFKVLKNSAENDNQVIYLITVPTFRSSKDIRIKEDILEEVVRCHGFNQIPLTLPSIPRNPFDTTVIMRTRKIKAFLASAAQMTEIQNYNLFDEQNLFQLNYDVANAIELVNPVSENLRRLVTSLIPSLLKNISANNVHHDELRFFELGRIWHSKGDDQVIEQKNLAGIFFAKRKTVDFYVCKNYIESLFQNLGLASTDEVTWKKLDTPKQPWHQQYQSAEIFIKNKHVGTAGKIDPLFLNKLDLHTECDAFFFELDADFLLTAPEEDKRYSTISKFQETYFDLSLMVPLTTTSDSLKKAAAKLNPWITKVELLDFFEKEEWLDVRSLTFRIWACSNEKTLEKNEIDNLRKQVIDCFETLGAKIRA